MPERMTPAELDAAEALAAAATEGPWRKHDIGGSGAQEPESIVVHTGQFDWEALQDGETSVAWMPRWDSQEDADAEFIAAARELVPRLVAEVRARDAVIEAVREGLDEVIAALNENGNYGDGGFLAGAAALEAAYSQRGADDDPR